jgi:hypothetical protein
MILKVYLIKLPILVDCMNSVELAPVASAFKIELCNSPTSPCRSLNSSTLSSHLVLLENIRNARKGNAIVST